MNSIDFLISLINNYEHFNLLINDFDLVLENFNVKMFDLNFSYTNIKGQDFLEQVKKDFQNITIHQVTKLSDALVSSNEFKKPKQYPLEKIIRDELVSYYINHSELIDINKYYRIIVNKVIFDIEQELQVHIRLNYMAKKYTYASITEEYQSYLLTFNENNRKGINHNAVIFRIYQSLYHEMYHVIVSELIKDPQCYKIDILQFQIAELLYTVPLVEKPQDFHEYFYEDYPEENNAELFGIKKAHEKLSKLNPAFHISAIQKFCEFDTKHFEPKTAITFKNFKTLSQNDLFEDLIDKNIVNHPEAIKGAITRIYNSDGQRKDLPTLIHEFNEALNTNDPKLTKDITEFYYYALYRIILKMTIPDLISYLNNESYQSIIINSLIFNKNRLENAMNNINTHKLYYLVNIYNHTLNKKVF